MHNLVRRVYAGVGTTGTDDFHWMVGDNTERFFHTLLDTEPGSLALPAVIRRTVVFDTERNAHNEPESVGLAWQRIEQLLCLLLLPLVALVENLFENAASTCRITHINVRTGEI